MENTINTVITFELHNIHIVIHHFIEQPVDNEIWTNAYQYFINGVAYHPYFKTHKEALNNALQKAENLNLI